MDDGIEDLSYRMSSQLNLNNNIIYSPMSISIVTGIVLVEASGGTIKEIDTVFKSRSMYLNY